MDLQEKKQSALALLSSDARCALAEWVMALSKAYAQNPDYRLPSYTDPESGAEHALDALADELTAPEELKERFKKWKKSVLPDDCVEALHAVTGSPEKWAAAWRERGGDMVEATRQYRAFKRGDDEALPGAVETVRTMRALLEKTGIECPPWEEPPSETIKT